MYYSPIEQFQIHSLIPLNLFSYNISFTNSSFFMLLSVTLIITFFAFSLANSTFIPTKWQSLSELIYLFVLTLVIENVGIKGNKYFTLIFTLFLFILVSNLLGMIPYSFTITSHIIITFGLSSCVFVGVTILGFLLHGIHFFSFFMPPGAPIGMAPLLVPIEIVSYISRVFSLAIRLFANMMSGHSLLKILAGFGWSMFTMGGIFYILSLIPVIIVIVITGLELGIAMLQAYVFTVLTCVYLGESIHLH